jgi:putative intracellular protease/amidase
MGKILCFIYNDMADFELTFSCHVLGTCAKLEIVPISYEMDKVVSNPGIIYYPRYTVKEALKLEDVDGLIIPGGWNDEQRPELTELIQSLNSNNKLLAAICAGPQYLARAGVLKGKRYTTTLTPEYIQSKGIEDPFPRNGYIIKDIVRDGNLVTAVGSAFVEFGIEIADALNQFEKEEEKKQFTNAYKCEKSIC